MFATRQPEKYGVVGITKMIQYGASPRATIAINYACRAYALLQNRHFVIPDDVKFVARNILRHRIVLTYHAQAENITADSIIDRIFEGVFTP